MEWAWLIPVFSFAAAPVIVAFGRYLPSKGAFLAIVAIAAGFGVFWVVLGGFLDASPSTENCFTSGHTESLTCNYQRSWFHAGDLELTWGILVDPLTVVMLGLVTFVALMVQVYSVAYMRGDSRFGWYFAVHALFAAAMSSIDSGINSITAVVLTDYIGRFRRNPLSKKAHVRLAKVIAITVGTVVITLSAYVMKHVPGNYVEMTQRITNLLISPIFILFFICFYYYSGGVNLINKA